MSAAVLITVPRYVAISPNPLSAKTISTMATNSNCGASSSDESTLCLRGKKRRLDHLSWEEKLQRKKLKNRVAAQTSRDRKKARMEDMEQHITELTEKTEILQNKCNNLQAVNESLLEKNHKLDKKIEILKQQLELLQNAQQRHQNESVTWNEGIKIDYTKQPTAMPSQIPTNLEREFSCSALEDCSALPSIQDMLEDFDATKLEELAESLLADITADMERSHPEGHTDATQDAGVAERLSGSMVGATPEVLEPSQYTSRSNIDVKANTVNTTVAPVDTCETIYGTYDVKTNSITIVVGDDAIAINEAVEEVYCEGEEPQNDEIIECGMTSNDVNNDDEDFDPMENCFSSPAVGKRNSMKSPLSIHSYSDPGYESIGSPQSDIDSTISSFDEIVWNSSISELFPSLM